MDTNTVMDMSQGFHAGNFDEAYVGGEPNQGGGDSVWEDAYIMGWFSSYDRSEIPEEWRDRFDRAYWSNVGRECVKRGWVDER